MTLAAKPLVAAIRHGLNTSGAVLWPPEVTHALVADRQTRLQFDPSRYSTSLFLGAAGPSLTICLGERTKNPGIRIEVIEPSIAGRFVSQGLDLSPATEITCQTVTHISTGAGFIGTLPALAESVAALAQSVHILRSPEPGIDVSYSAPDIPFSVFLSVPNGPDAHLRIAEALIHEAMHLQLTLVEALVPLAADETSTSYSPWKQATRPLSGIIHALYVFRTIDRWLTTQDRDQQHSTYVARRRRQIADEIAEVDVTTLKASLTREGRLVLDRLQPICSSCLT